MDPSVFVRLVVGIPTLKLPANSRHLSAGVNSDDSPCFCVIKFKNFPSQTLSIPFSHSSSAHRRSSLSHSPSAHPRTSRSHSPSACFYLNPTDLDNLCDSSNLSLHLSIYIGRPGLVCCSPNRKHRIGRVRVPIDARELRSNAKPFVFHSGWVSMGDGAELYLNVKADPNPRFVFRFDGPPERSPQVFQIRGTSRHTVFTCKFSCRSSPGRSSRRERPAKERKGWSLTVHDLSGSPVAVACMATPFVPSPGSNRVRKANPGAWLVLRPAGGSWKPCARLEAWRDSRTGVGLRFQILPEGSIASGVTLAETSVSIKRGGKLMVDIKSSGSCSPFSTPGGSFDSGSGFKSFSSSGSDYGPLYSGFVMSCTTDGSGENRPPQVEVGSEHVTCTEDAAVFVALAAAADLSIDACRLFTTRLSKEFRPENTMDAV